MRLPHRVIGIAAAPMVVLVSSCSGKKNSTSSPSGESAKPALRDSHSKHRHRMIQSRLMLSPSKARPHGKDLACLWLAPIKHMGHHYSMWKLIIGFFVGPHSFAASWL